MRPLALLVLMGASAAFAQDQPLTALPYTPGLEPKFMDRSADPCADFYKFSCGGWIAQNPIPPDQASWNVYAKLADENQRFLWGILQAAAKPGAQRSPNEQKIGDLFGACMNESAIENAGIKPIEDDLAEVAGLPRIDSIAAYIAEQHGGGVGRGVLFGFGSDQDFDNSSSVIAFASAGGLGLPDRDYYVKSDAKSQEIRKRYVELIAKMLGMIGESGPDASADAQTVMSIETALAQASLTRVERRNPYNLKHKSPLDSLRTTYPAFDWDAYLEKLAPPRSKEVNITEPKFFEALNRLLSEQKLPAWRAYLRWHLVRSRANYLPHAYQQASFDFYSAYLRGVKAMPPRWKTCTRLVDRSLPDALGQVFVQRTFSAATKDDAKKVTEQVEAEMGRDIKDLTWMSDATKARALEKLRTVVNKIGYPDKWRDYSSVSINPSAFLPDVLHAASFETRRDLNKIGKPVDRSEWGMSPPTVNAYYNAQMNDINFPAGVLQPPLFDPKMDAAPNYGNTGATIGHELTHGFDDEGRQFDAAGNLKDWWTPADAKAFEERVNCVRDQYAQYVVVDDIHINSKLTSGEDVADLGGTLLAYLAWKRATTGQTLKDADGLTPGQRFFVGMAQWACGDEREENKRVNATVNPHSPEKYRINGVVSNLHEFGQAFGCKAGAPMVREKACRVW